MNYHFLANPATRISNPETEIEKSVQKQLIDKSLEETIVRHCPDDSQRRFKDSKAFREWSTEVDTVLFNALSEEGDLCGTMFYRKKTHPRSQSDLTMAVRVYSGYERQGLAKQLILESYHGIQKIRQSEAEEVREDMLWLQSTTGMWLSVHTENQRAQFLYENLGFHVVSLEVEKKRIIMEYDG